MKFIGGGCLVVGIFMIGDGTVFAYGVALTVVGLVLAMRKSKKTSVN